MRSFPEMGNQRSDYWVPDKRLFFMFISHKRGARKLDDEGRALDIVHIEFDKDPRGRIVWKVGLHGFQGKLMKRIQDT